MAVTMERYVLSSYTDDTWTELASPASGTVMLVRHLTICNLNAGARNVSLRITQSNGTTVLAQLMSVFTVASNETVMFGPNDLFIVLKTEEQLQIKASGADVHFYSGVGEET